MAYFQTTITFTFEIFTFLLINVQFSNLDKKNTIYIFDLHLKNNENEKNIININSSISRNFCLCSITCNGIKNS